ncbi:hypothetical protein N9S30_00100 [bacterium]|nr:hypothetical protein [bacterium]
MMMKMTMTTTTRVLTKRGKSTTNEMDDDVLVVLHGVVDVVMARRMRTMLATLVVAYP